MDSEFGWTEGGRYRFGDVGCGTGSLLLAAAEQVGTSGRLYGVEPSPEMVAYARSKAETRQVDVQITEGSADKLPYDAASFDVVFCTLVLHHLPETMQTSALKEMRRVLHPGGRIVMVDWQRPKSIAKALFSPTFLVYLLHTLGSVESAFDKLGIEARLAELCFDKIARVPFGAGAIAAVTGRLGPSI